MESSRVVLVTGGTSGIGLETVRRFASAGHKVFTCSRNEFDFLASLGHDVASRITHAIVDVGQSDELKNWVTSIGDSMGRVDVLVNNAACVIRKPIEDFSSSEFVQSLNVNLLSVLEATRAALPFLRVGVDSALINISSMAAIDPFPGFSVYGSCKAFIEVFTRAIANEVADDNISCYSIRAGAVETPLLRKVLPEFPMDETLKASQLAELIYQVARLPNAFDRGEAIEVTPATIEEFDLPPS